MSRAIADLKPQLLLSAPIIALLLASCTVRTEPTISSSSGTPPTISSVSIVPDGDSDSNRAKLRKALAAELAANTIAISGDENIVLDYSISRNSADAALLSSEAGQAKSDPEPIVIVREANWLDACPTVRIRAMLVLFERESGTVIKRSAAEAITCENDDVPYTEFAKVLVQDALTP